MPGVRSCAFGIFLFLTAAGFSAAAGNATEWLGGNGRWNDPAKWSAGLPDALTEATVGGSSTVVIPAGAYVAALLAVGNRADDRARVELNGGQLVLRQDSLRIGEYTDSQGTFA